MFRVVSGGQSGVDRAALDAALLRQYLHGGWCPAGRLAEDGVIDESYQLLETPSENHQQRTEWNVRDSDGTLLLFHGSNPGGGTAFTIECAERLGRPWLAVDPRCLAGVTAVRTWIHEHSISVLNVAGPRESKCGGIYHQALHFMIGLLDSLGTAH